jgi:hypothetical protein
MNTTTSVGLNPKQIPKVPKSSMAETYKSKQSFAIETAQNIKVNHPINSLKKARNAELIQNLLFNQKKVFVS